MIGALLAVLSVAPLAVAQETWDARLTAVSGSVMVFVQAEGLPAKKDLPLQDGDRIKIGPDSTAELSLEGKSLISLRPNTDITIGSLRRADSAFSLSQGGLLAKVKDLAGGGLSVKTPAAVATVRGTEFGVEIPAESPEEAYVGVFDEGKVEVRGSGGGGQMLQSNQEAKAAKGQAPASPSILGRFAKYRGQVRAMRGRIKTLRKAWKTLSPAEREAKRDKILALMRQTKKKEKEGKAQKEKGKEKESAAKRANREKMDKDREAVRRKLGR